MIVIAYVTALTQIWAIIRADNHGRGDGKGTQNRSPKG
jgi:hypothetical protein